MDRSQGRVQVRGVRGPFEKWCLMCWSDGPDEQLDVKSVNIWSAHGPCTALSLCATHRAELKAAL
jgi:hypothetical protein